MHATQEALNFLEKCPRIQNLPSLQALAKVCVPVSHRVGETLFREASEAHHIYLLCEGTVRFSTIHRGGKEIVFGDPLHPGHFFGEVASLSTNELGDHRRTATCTSLQEVAAVKITWSDLKQFIVDHPDSIALMELLVTDMADRLRRSGRQLSRFELHDPNKGLEPQGDDLKVRTWARSVSSLRLLTINMTLIVLWVIGSVVFKEYFNNLITGLGCLVTVEALLVTVLVLNSQDREATRQEKRVARQYANVQTTLDAVEHLKDEITELRAELYPVTSGTLIAPPERNEHP